jgi:hypothetical protein
MVPTISNMSKGIIAWTPDSRASVSVQQRRSFDELSPIPTPLTFVRVMRITCCIRVELEQLPEIILSEMPCGIFSLIDDTC